ncbi:hypothetical protein AB6804_31220 [Caballeronia sp. RCC_10]
MNSLLDKSGAASVPMPSRNFAATRRALTIALIASILVPLLCIAAYGYFDYQRRIADAYKVPSESRRDRQPILAAPGRDGC